MEILQAKYLEGSLTDAERLEWEKACRENPELVTETRVLEAIQNELFVAAKESGANRSAATSVEGALPKEGEGMPDAMRAQLRAAREDSSSKSRSSPETEQVAEFPAQGSIARRASWRNRVVAIAAMLVVFAGAYAVWRGGGPDASDGIVIKSAGISDQLPILIPDREMLVKDPPILWMGFMQGSAAVEVRSIDGETVYFQKAGATSPVDGSVWAASVPSEAVGVIVRVETSTATSEQGVRFDQDAKPRSDWTTERSDQEILTLARSWLASGRPADSYALLDALIVADELQADLQALRKEAFAGALAASRSGSGDD